MEGSLPNMRFHLICGLAAAIVAALSGMPTRASSQDNSTLADSLIPEMEQVFADIPRMVDHTMTVLGHALDIHGQEGGVLSVVQAAAILHDIGIPKAREKHGSSAGEYQEMEGPPIAREILSRLGFPEDQIDLVCGIVANHHSDADPRIVNTADFKILWDADWLVNFPRRYRDATTLEKASAIDEIFKTARGRELARGMFLN
jgi:hypothetical protein